jgi:hypothetical protein
VADDHDSLFEIGAGEGLVGGARAGDQPHLPFWPIAASADLAGSESKELLGGHRRHREHNVIETPISSELMPSIP